jgi:AraC-like DNA-binding protein
LSLLWVQRGVIVRRARALHLLQQGTAIREVARAYGFTELSPFYRAFRRWQGETSQTIVSAC